MNNFFRRTLTGAWIVIFVMGGFWLHPVSFFLTGLIMLIGTQYEYYLMIRNTGVKPQIGTGYYYRNYSICYFNSYCFRNCIPENSFLVLIPMMLIIMVMELYRKQEKPFDSLAHTFFSVLYTAVPFSMFPFSAFSRTGLNSLLPHDKYLFFTRNNYRIFSSYLGK